jgi:integrase
MSMERWMLEPDRIVTDEAGREIGQGAYWRRNQKYRRCVPDWIPMQPELRLAVPELLEDVGPARDALITGRVWNLKRTWDMAADRATAEGHEIPRVTPTDLRRGGASMLSGRGYSVEAIRIALGHAAGGGAIMGGPSSRPSVATRHYLWSTPGLFDPRSPPSGT